MNLYYWIAIGITAVISMLANSFVMRSYAQYKEIRTRSGLTGAQVARKILDDNGLHDVAVVRGSGGTLSDFYDPSKKIVSLSPDNYANASVAASAVAAHEVGHAIQHATGYKFIALRNMLLKPTIIASQFSQIAIIIGLTSTALTGLFDLGIIMISIILAFQVVTLPVEFNASARALKIIKSDGIVDSSEYGGAQKMLTAAALTYVAAVIGTLLNLLYFVMLRGSRNKD